MNDYPALNLDVAADLKETIRVMVEERLTDVKDFDNLQNRFMSGRKTGKIPSGASDIASTDKLGDFNTDNAYFYIVVNDAGAAVWARIPLDIAW